jgi:hypothetical protein
MDKQLAINTLITMADELDPQAVLLHQAMSVTPFGTREDWEAFEHITRAIAHLRAAARALDF